jgi:hypothetical protein
LLNYVFLLLWWGIFSFAHDWVRRVHGRWFHLPEGSFDTINYCSMALYKILIFMFNLVPYLVLRLFF